MAKSVKKDAVGHLGLSGYVKVYPSSRSMGAAVRKEAAQPTTKSAAVGTVKRPKS
ncbi:MAG: hypothetical protein ABI635_00015 [Actinomycetota bacterium]